MPHIHMRQRHMHAAHACRIGTSHHITSRSHRNTSHSITSHHITSHHIASSQNIILQRNVTHHHATSHATHHIHITSAWSTSSTSTSHPMLHLHAYDPNKNTLCTTGAASIFSHIRFGNHYGDGHKLTKREMCVEEGAVALIDDR